MKLKDFLPEKPLIAIQLGSGLSTVADMAENIISINYGEIDGLIDTSVEGHSGEFVFGYIEKKPILFLKGRTHYYEGHDLKDVVKIIHLIKEIGTEILFLTNAAGAINKNFSVKDLMLITDHINFSGANPLIGPVKKGEIRFPDQTNVYDKNLQKIIKAAANKVNIDIQEGVYIWFSGPSYETPAEIRAARILGADAVGMSTVPEAMVANQLGIKVCGISTITNMGAGILDKPLSHGDVILASNISINNFKILFKEFVRRI